MQSEPVASVKSRLLNGLGQVITLPGSLTLASGLTLSGLTAQFSAFGRPASNHSNVFVVGHGLTCSDRLDKWWELFHREIDLEKYCLICISSLGSSYESTGPGNHLQGHQQGEPNFPKISVADQADFYAMTLRALGVERARGYLGASLGGMLGLELYFRYPDLFERFILAGVSRVSNTVQNSNKNQISLVKNGLCTDDPKFALKYARMSMRLSCKSSQLSVSDRQACIPEIELESDDFVDRFLPEAFIRMTEAITDFEPSQNRSPLSAKTLHKFICLISIDNDLYTPVSHVESLAGFLKEEGAEITQDHFQTDMGHESWILEGGRFCRFISKYL